MSGPLSPAALWKRLVCSLFATGSLSPGELAWTRQQRSARPGRTEGRPILTQPQHPPPGRHPDGNGRLLAAFDSYLARQARSPGTRRKYGDALGRYTVWLQGRAPGSVQADEIDGYLEQWRERFHQQHARPPATGSYRAQINALRAFYTYLDRFSLITDRDGRPQPDPMRNILPPRGEPTRNDWLRPTEDQALLRCPGSLQERFLIALLRWSGLRVSEASSLTLADLDLSPGQEAITVRQSKT